MSKHNEIRSITRRSGLLEAITSRIASFWKTRADNQQAVSENAKTFRNLLDIANEIASRDSTALFCLITAILRPLQAEQILSVAEREQHAARDPVDLYRLFSADDFFSIFEQGDCDRLPAANYQVDLAKDIVMPTPWRRKGFVSALTTIGREKSSGAWRQDPNHGIDLVLPWRICLVTGGNHSITAGILANEGVLTPSCVFDLAPLLDRVRCDGDHFICRSSNERIARVKNGRMAALYEIGRLLKATEHRHLNL